MKTHILTVTQFTSQIKILLEGAFPEIWIEGEISNLSIPQSGHAYFTLKDEQTQIRAVLFRSSHRFLKFTLQHGMQVICRGRVSIYESRGEYQLILDYIEPKGVGALQLAFEERKAKLEKEGLFEVRHKQNLPLLPHTIGVITSPTGAAIRDMLRVIKRRHPRMHLLIYPVPVQGAEAAPSIVEAIRYFGTEQVVDVIILGRGGGSLEDLWAFNEEIVARAIYASKIPIISAVGHETDYTISDFVADVRASTPSAAAELVVQSEEAFCEFIKSLETRLSRTIRRRLELSRATLRELTRVIVHPGRKLEQFTQRVDELTGRLATGLTHHIRRDKALLATRIGALEHLNPLSILSRGYSITKKIPAGTILKTTTNIAPGDLISTRLHQGEIVSRVESLEAANSTENNVANNSPH